MDCTHLGCSPKPHSVPIATLNKKNDTMVLISELMAKTGLEWAVIESLPIRNYVVSNTGLVVNLKTGRFCKPQKDGKGYLRTRLYKNEKDAVTFKVHRLVAIYFIGNPEKKPEVNHKNGVKHDNRSENLEWATTAENIRHARETGLHKITDGMKESARRLLTGNTYSCKKIINTASGEIFNSVKDAAKSINLSRSALSGMLTGFRTNWTNLHYYEL